MKDKADLIVLLFYGAFGAFLGLLIFMFALGGSSYVFTGTAGKSWNGAMGLVVCCVLGYGWGLLSYALSEREIGKRESRFFHDPATAILFAKRLMVIATCLAGVYFLWQLAKSL